MSHDSHDYYDAPTVPGVASELLAGPDAGELVFVHAAKGGAGSTTVAAHVANHLARRGSRSVCLVDLDLSKGDLAGALDLRSKRSINGLLDRLDRLDAPLVAGVADVLDNGLHVLAQPYELMDIHQLEPMEVRRLFAGLRRIYDVVVVDSGARIDVAALTAATEASRILMVATPDVPSIRAARRTLRLLEQVRVPTRDLHLVVNKKPWIGGLSVDEIAAMLPIEVTAVIRRADRLAAQADTRGMLLGDVAPLSGLRRDLDALWPQVEGLALPISTGGLWARVRAWLRPRRSGVEVAAK